MVPFPPFAISVYGQSMHIVGAHQVSGTETVQSMDEERPPAGTRPLRRDAGGDPKSGLGAGRALAGGQQWLQGPSCAATDRPLEASPLVMALILGLA